MSNIIMPVASDAFSSLPNDLLCIILSKIPIREAVRCSVLAKRWRFLYNQIPRLTFSPYLVLGRTVTPDPQSIATAENIISNILRSHSRALEAFHLFNDTDGTNQWQFTQQSVRRWVQYAAYRNVQQLNLSYSSYSPAQEIPPPALFFCTHLTSLTLSNYILTDIPTHFPGLSHLIICSFQYLELTDESLVRLTSHCPLLQTLEITFCTGLYKPAISAPNITVLKFIVEQETLDLTVNCPKLRTMVTEICLVRDLRVNGVLFHELSHAVVKLEMQNGINLTKLRLEAVNLSAQRFLDIVGNFKALRKLDIEIWEPLEREQEMVVPLISLFQRLPDLELLKIRDMFLQELTMDKIPPCLNRPLANLSYLKVEIKEFSQKEMDVMKCLLRSAPPLQNLKLELPNKYEEAQYSGFLQNLLHLKGDLSLPFTIL